MAFYENQEVEYKDRAGRRRRGVIDMTANRFGQDLYRVKDRWFSEDGIKAVDAERN